MDDAQAETSGAYYAAPTFKERFWRWSGFHGAHAPRPEEDEEAEGWAPSWFIVGTRVYLGWPDRFRVLLSGKLHVEQAIKTDVPIGRSRSTSAVGILPPGTKTGAW